MPANHTSTMSWSLESVPIFFNSSRDPREGTGTTPAHATTRRGLIAEGLVSLSSRAKRVFIFQGALVPREPGNREALVIILFTSWGLRFARPLWGARQYKLLAIRTRDVQVVLDSGAPLLDAGGFSSRRRCTSRTRGSTPPTAPHFF